MTIYAHSTLSTTANSLETGRQMAEELRRRFGDRPQLIVTYLTLNHEAADYLRGVREVFGPAVPVLGCSAQGVLGLGKLREDGFAAGAVALGGPAMSTSQGCVEEIADDAFAKGAALGEQLIAGSEAELKVVVLHYDALSGVDADALLSGLHSVVRCDIVGGAAAYSYNYTQLRATHQYFGTRVLERAAVAFGLAGNFRHLIECAHGCAPVGVELTVTRSDGPILLELDGKPATSVWEQIAGTRDSPALAIGVPVTDSGGEYYVRAAYGSLPERGGVILGTPLPVGQRIMLHHRSVEDVIEGTRGMAERLKARLEGRAPRAVFCFECGARTRTFLGDEAALEENLELQIAVGEHAAWIGMLPWGEVLPIDGKPTFHNYSYATLVLTD